MPMASSSSWQKRKAGIRVGGGRFTYLKITSDEVAARKQEEIEREDRCR